MSWCYRWRFRQREDRSDSHWYSLSPPHDGGDKVSCLWERGWEALVRKRNAEVIVVLSYPLQRAPSRSEVMKTERPSLHKEAQYSLENCPPSECSINEAARFDGSARGTNCASGSLASLPSLSPCHVSGQQGSLWHHWTMSELLDRHSKSIRRVLIFFITWSGLSPLEPGRWGQFGRWWQKGRLPSSYWKLKKGHLSSSTPKFMCSDAVWFESEPISATNLRCGGVLLYSLREVLVLSSAMFPRTMLPALSTVIASQSANGSRAE